MSQNNFKQQVNEGFVRGLTGSEEPTSMARVLHSPEPLPNEMLTIKKLYVVCLICLGASIIIPPLLFIGLLGPMIVYCIDVSVVDHKRDRLRRFKFKFSENIDYENLFLTVQPIFFSKYNMLVERREDGVLMLTHNGYTYDILLEDDATFTIWWRMSGASAFVPKNKYKSYRQILASMGVIAFEIQKAYNIK